MNTRYNPKRDANEREIVKVAKRFGCSVARLNGKDIPDLIIGFRHVVDGSKRNILVEVKNENNPLTNGQMEFHLAWQGSIHVVYTIHDLCRVLRKEMGFDEKWARMKLQKQRRV